MKFVSNLSFKAKLISLCLFMSLVSIVIGAVSYKGLADVSAPFVRLTEKVMPKMAEANEMYISFRRLRGWLPTLGLPGLSEAQTAEVFREAKKSIDMYEDSRKTYVALGFIEGQKALYDDVDSQWTHFKKMSDKVGELQKSGRKEDRDALVGMFLKEVPEAATQFSGAMEKLLQFHKTVAAERSAEAKEVVQQTNTTVIILSISGVFLGLLVGVLFANSVSKTISLVTENLSKSVEQVSAASSEIASSSEELSQAATEQASSLEETASSLEEITAMIAKASESANSAAMNSSESQRKADEGRKAVDQMLSAMSDISHSNDAIMGQVTQSNQQMAEIVRVIQEIGTKTKVINEIVFQTKLLSFNASVEAARAGEHGKGFAVVAEEVGSLAQMSGNAAKEISDMLENSISKVEKIVSDTKTGVSALVDDGKRKIETGVAVANQCSNLLNDIVQNVSLVSGLAQEIAVASKEQSQGVGEINKAMGQLDTVTQQNAATSEQTASAAEELSAQADTLKDAVLELVVIVRGASGGQPLVNETPSKAGKSKARFASPQKTAKTGQVVSLKSNTRELPNASRNLHAASGGDHVPRRDDDGFRDI